MAVTMRDVAAHAGVSPVVVSRVLHNKAHAIRVSEKTAERVRKSADELGYSCNVWARNFRSQRTLQLGVIHGIGFPRPTFSEGSRYFAHLADGIVEGAFENGYAITLCPTLLNENAESAMADGRFDGYIWYSSLPSEEHRRMLSQLRIPTVVLHSTAEDVDGKWPTVICDNRQGIGLSVDHLVGLGHKRIVHLTEFGWGHGEARKRADAFLEAMDEHGLTASEKDIVDVSWNYSLVRDFLTSVREYTAVVCHSDATAAIAMKEAASLGIKVPDDLSLVGFDSTAFCNEMSPRLTSVKQPLFDLGRVASNVLVKTINSQEVAPTTVLPCGFDVRESTAAPSR